MSDNPVDDAALEAAKGSLEHAEKIEHEKLAAKLKCGNGHLTDIPADIQAKMDADEDLGALPGCSECGEATAISITGA